MEVRFKVPVTQHTQTLDSVLQIAASWLTLPQRKKICRKGIMVDDTKVTKPTFELEPGSLLQGEVPDPLPDFDMYECPELIRYEGISFIDKIVSMPGELDETPFDPLLYVADGLGYDREIFDPIWNADFMLGGPWLLAEDTKRSASFAKDFVDSKIVMTWVALVPGAHHAPISTDQITLDVAMSKKVGEICELQITTKLHDVKDIKSLPSLILDALESVKIPVLGDIRRGGFATSQGIRLRLLAVYTLDGNLSTSWTPPSDWWPDEIIVPLIEKPKFSENDKLLANLSLKEFVVSDLSLRYINEGHPWVTRDKSTDRGNFEEGTFVILKTPKGTLGPVAIFSGEDPVVARFWGARFQNQEELEEEIAFRLDEAIGKRSSQFSDLVETDSFRIVHGENDNLPGISIDRFGPVFRVTVRSAGTFRAFRKILYDNLIAIDDETMIIEAMHDKDIRVDNALPDVQIISHGKQHLQHGDRLIIRELGLKYWLEVWEGIDVGFFCDQRENRRRLEKFAEKGSRWLNLFSHTGAFSVRLAQLGASTVNVDLSKRYLDWFLENLELNKFDTEAHECHAQDARQYLDRCEELFDGMIVDPPTSSSGEGGFWSLKRDYEALLRQCVTHLKPGGTLLVCRNERSGKIQTQQMVQKLCKSMGRKTTFFDASSGGDFPTKAAFPEGTTFDGVWVQLD